MISSCRFPATAPRSNASCAAASPPTPWVTRSRSKSATTLRRSAIGSSTAREERLEAIRWLLKLEPWDLFIAIFGETHRGGHLLWAPDGDTAKAGPSDDLLAVYETIDTGLGIDPRRRREHERGLSSCSRFTAWRETFPALPRCPSSWTASINSTTPKRRRRRQPPPAKRDAISPKCGSGAAPARDRSARSGWRARRVVRVHRHTTGRERRALRCSPIVPATSGSIGRDVRRKAPAVGKLRGETLHSHDRDAFRELVDARTGDQIVADVLPRAALFSGEADFLPDLFVTWREESSSRARSDRLGVLPREPHRPTGNHTANGFAYRLTDGDLTALPPLTSVTELAVGDRGVSPISQPRSIR